ncbi:hypothetical protein [Dyadobacter arcticus]|uniref:Nucleic acid-binding Zn-ribbon protein n=1 Tax=Dyadobacter arcticus TaxID=1078754 RepID=A0ABX0UNX0_9BACT|nr:hypothetical protein [Dyadobacter arcticus]NIJ54656.1 putative nucleic acid-binding Zn-ribbon protein [Dyadobacter arcticus]
MEPKNNLRSLDRQINVFLPAISLICILCIFISCNKQDRTTVIYGKVTDQNHQAVDSILVVAGGLWDFNIEVVKQIYTDENGNYELVIDVPKKYIKLNV